MIRLILFLCLFTLSFNKNIDEQVKTYDKSEQKCAYEVLWFEARGESEQGIHAVASVLVNRTNSYRYSNKICEVAKQRKQFSFYNKKGKAPTIIVNKTSYNKHKIIEEISVKIALGEYTSRLPDNVLWYHASWIKTDWSSELKEYQTIGKHTFYATNP